MSFLLNLFISDIKILFLLQYKTCNGSDNLSSTSYKELTEINLLEKHNGLQENSINPEIFNMPQSKTTITIEDTIVPGSKYTKLWEKLRRFRLLFLLMFLKLSLCIMVIVLSTILFDEKTSYNAGLVILGAIYSGFFVVICIVLICANTIFK
ncbi:hypothetical protein NGRA_0441 [Nosema granulosis]|uniref:Uncharacterized protein n=1 Tax=Nosema granulosis TaxID=83296 RepID=A0A9P6H1D1_9MICR|nr:hypothetical protein NGRA_0441 [Nosema granulosis]